MSRKLSNLEHLYLSSLSHQKISVLLHNHCNISYFLCIRFYLGQIKSRYNDAKEEPCEVPVDHRVLVNYNYNIWKKYQIRLFGFLLS